MSWQMAERAVMLHITAEQGPFTIKRNDRTDVTFHDEPISNMGELPILQKRDRQV